MQKTLWKARIHCAAIMVVILNTILHWNLEIRFGIWGAFSSSLKCKSQALTANINGAGKFTQTVIQGLGACLFAFLRNFELTLGSMPNDRLVVANHPVLVLSSID